MVQLTSEKTKRARRARLVSRIKRRFLKHLWLARLGIASVALLILIPVFWLIGISLRGSKIGMYIGVAKSFVFAEEKDISSIDSKTNLILLGKAGGDSSGPDLTDTIIFASFSHKKKVVTLISLPRDIWIPALRAKLNSAYYWGNQKVPDGGLVLAKSSVEEIIGQPVHYGVVIDFSGFVQMVDVLDGIEVGVERGFVDESYPIAGMENDECDGDPEYSCRYEIVRFDEGSQVMDGQTTLKFVRSRNAEGDEGTDLARAARQQKIIAALQSKTLSTNTLFAIPKLKALIDISKTSIETDLAPSEAAVLARRIAETNGGLDSTVLSEDLLVNPPKSFRYDNQYVFIPKADDWGDVHEWVDCILEGQECGND